MSETMTEYIFLAIVFLIFKAVYKEGKMLRINPRLSTGYHIGGGFVQVIGVIGIAFAIVCAISTTFF